MAHFGKVLFSGSRYIFWGVAPFTLGLAIYITSLIDSWTSSSTIVVLALDALCVLLILALYSPERFSWAGRAATGIVFIGYLANVIDETIWKPHPSSFSFRAFEAPWTAIEGFAVIGLPCLYYTVLGRFRWRKDEAEGDERALNQPVRAGKSSQI